MIDAWDLFLLLLLKRHGEHLLSLKFIDIRQAIPRRIHLLPCTSTLSPVLIHSFTLAGIIQVPLGREHQAERPVTAAGVGLGAEHKPLPCVANEPFFQVHEREHELVILLQPLLGMRELHVAIWLEQIDLVFQFDGMDWNTTWIKS